MARYGKQYRTIGEIQDALYQTITSQTADGSEKASCARAWMELEWARREMRGIPRFKALEFGSVINMKRARAPQHALELIETHVDAQPATMPQPDQTNAATSQPDPKAKESTSTTDPSPHHPEAGGIAAGVDSI